jgi:hypothetical protein
VALAAENERKFAAKQKALEAQKAQEITHARKLWGASETNQPTVLRIPKATPRSQGPKILRLPRGK